MTMTALVDSKQKAIPCWDPIEKRLSGHYEYQKVLTLTDKLQETEEMQKNIDSTFEMTEVFMDNFTVKIARALKLIVRNVKEVPSPIRKWCRRVFQLYIHTDLCNSWKSGTINTRFALDLTDYIYSFRYRDLFNQALIGELTNLQFRNIKKERKQND